MARFFLTLAYNGKNYIGWQVQPNGDSVQGAIQHALSTILRSNIEIVGAGRTDAGVHARKMIAHFDWDGEQFDAQELVYKLNGFLPKDIAIDSIKSVQYDAHARFSATSRTYKYYVTTEKDPFLHTLKHQIFFDPDMRMMNRLCNVLFEYEDFTSFSKLHTDTKTNNCKITIAEWQQADNDYIFTIQADRFLRNMVRAIVGTLLEGGRGRLDERGLRRIIEAKDRRVAGESVPGHALFLENIAYPDNIWL